MFMLIPYGLSDRGYAEKAGRIRMDSLRALRHITALLDKRKEEATISLPLLKIQIMDARQACKPHYPNPARR